MSRLNFKLEAQASGSNARAGRFQTAHGEVITPVFMPVGTQATVKSQTVDTLLETGAQVLLANTYHLLLRPGMEVFRRFGGIHSFMKWDRVVLTDSGGFQIFSLPHSRKLSDDGALFKSYVDGQSILLSPELSIEMQQAIGSDIMMVLDQCVPSTVERALAREAMERTHRWAIRSFKARTNPRSENLKTGVSSVPGVQDIQGTQTTQGIQTTQGTQALFAIVQGACFQDLRKESADFLTQIDFDGFAIGGLAVGESKAERHDFTQIAAELLPTDRPRYLMGVGTPLDILEAVHRGVDMFDCILPTALAQRGVAFTSQGKLQMRRSAYKFADERLDPLCTCKACAFHSKAYLHHLVKAGEPLGWHLLGIHNLYFYHQLMAGIRKSIFNGTFLEFYRAKREYLDRSDGAAPELKRPRARRLEVTSVSQSLEGSSGSQAGCAH